MDTSFEPYRLYLDPRKFPNASQGCIARSPQDPRYNCIAFAANETERFWWWPHGQKTYWPEDIPRKETPNSFLKLFQSLGYTNCNNGSYEIGFEKIAIYAKDKKVTHAARQLPNGKWVSKLGTDIDIEHETVENLEGPHYGEVVRYLKRSSPS